MQRRDLQTALENNSHHGIHLILVEDHVAHHDRGDVGTESTVVGMGILGDERIPFACYCSTPQTVEETRQ